jgi:site-specific recombinase XerD
MTERKRVNEASHLTVIDDCVPAEADDKLPVVIVNGGRASQNAWHDYFENIQNPHTRAAYEHAVRRFLKFLPRDFAPKHVKPAHVGRYIATHPSSIPTRKLHLSALRAFFDLLVTRHIMLINPAACVRGLRYEAVEGKTREITIEQAKKLLKSIQIERKTKDDKIVSLPIGLRDRAIIATLIYTAARAGAVARLRGKDFQHDGSRWTFRFAEKGGKSRDIPVRHDLEEFILAYLEHVPDWQSASNAPLFRTTVRKTAILTINALSNVDICRMVKRRLADAELPENLSPHSFRVTTITDLLTQGVPLEDVQYLAGHADPRTTRLYDRRQKQVTRNIVERISI